MKNVMVALDEDTLRLVDGAAGPLGLSRSEVVRQALRQWLRQRAVEGFEHKFIAALRERPDEPARGEDWLPPQTWSRR